MFFKCFLSLSIAFSWHRIVDNERLLPVSNVALLIRQYIRRSSGSGAAAVQKSKQLLSNLIYRTWSIDQVLNFTWSNSKRNLSRSNSPTFEYIRLNESCSNVTLCDFSATALAASNDLPILIIILNLIVQTSLFFRT